MAQQVGAARSSSSAGASTPKIWLDPNLPSYSTLIPLIYQLDASLSQDRSSASILIIHPATSMHIFDQYCHPEWLSAGARLRRQEQGVKEPAEGERKVIVTENWPRVCAAAGRLLGAGDNWVGCRKGGPPKSLQPSPAPTPRPNHVVPSPIGPAAPRSSTSKIIPRDPPTAPRSDRLAGFAPPTAPRSQRPAPFASNAEAGPSTPAVLPRAHHQLEFSPSPPITARHIVRHKLEFSPSPEPAKLISDVKPVHLPTHKTPPTPSFKPIKQPQPASASTSKRSTPPSVSVPSPSRFPPRVPYSTAKYEGDEMDEMLRNAHPLSLVDGKGKDDVLESLAAKYPILHIRSWRKNYANWLLGTGRYEPLATADGYLAHLDILTGYLPLIKTGTSLWQISDKLVKDHPGYRYSAEEWNMHLGDWLRQMEPSDAIGAVPMPLAPKPQPKAAPVAPVLPRRSTVGQKVTSEIIVVDSSSEESGSDSEYGNDADGEYGVPGRSRSRERRAVSGDTSARGHWKTQYSVDELNDIFRDAHPLSLEKGRSIGQVFRLLGKQRTRLTTTSWRKLYKAWRASSKRFAPLANEKGYLPYVPTFTRYLPHVVKGTSVKDIAAKLVASQPTSKLSAAEWRIHFGNWLRTIDDAVALIPATKAREPAFVPDAAPSAQKMAPDNLHKRHVAEAAARRLIVARVFKKDFDVGNGPRPRSKDIGLEVSRQTGINASTCENCYRLWENRHPRFADIPDDLQPSLSLSQPVSPTIKRKRASTSTAPTKRQRLAVDVGVDDEGRAEMSNSELVFSSDDEGRTRKDSELVFSSEDEGGVQPGDEKRHPEALVFSDDDVDLITPQSKDVGEGVAVDLEFSSDEEALVGRRRAVAAAEMWPSSDEE